MHCLVNSSQRFCIFTNQTVSNRCSSSIEVLLSEFDDVVVTTLRNVFCQSIDHQTDITTTLDLTRRICAFWLIGKVSKCAIQQSFINHLIEGCDCCLDICAVFSAIIGLVSTVSAVRIVRWWVSSNTVTIVTTMINFTPRNECNATIGLTARCCKVSSQIVGDCQLHQIFCLLKSITSLSRLIIDIHKVATYIEILLAKFTSVDVTTTEDIDRNCINIQLKVTDTLIRIRYGEWRILRHHLIVCLVSNVFFVSLD